MGGGDWGEKWRNSKECAVVKREIQELNEEALAKPDETSAEALQEYSTPFMFQLKTILKRTVLAAWRQADYGFTRLHSHASISLITSLTFLQLGNSVVELQYRVFAFFIVTVLPVCLFFVPLITSRSCSSQLSYANFDLLSFA